MRSAFGVEHGGISKAEKEATAGRYVTSWALPGAHGAVAGKKGKKLRATGSELAGFTGGAVGGSIAGLGAARLTHSRGAAKAVHAGTAAAGSMLGTAHAQRKGHYKPQRKGAL
jgi:hypothetical protein